MLKKLLNNKYLLFFIIIILFIVSISVYSILRTPNGRVLDTLENNKIGGLTKSIFYDEKSKTLKLDADEMEKNEYGNEDLAKFIKTIPQLFKLDLVHQFEFSRAETTDFAGGTKLNFKIISGTQFRFKEENFYSWKWSKQDKGICSRNIKVIPQFAHVSEKSAKEIENALHIDECKLWNSPKKYEKIN